jgi:hypothetical protein
MLALFTITIFLGALALFLVQPMVGRMLLPLLGGAPAIWNTAMVFYQAVLLAGYAYAHFATRWFGVRRQSRLHLALLWLPLLALPIAIPRDWMPPAAHDPILWLLATLTMMIGLPFFVLSATSPLLQRWFSASSHRDAGDPYFLYAASNSGSLLALIIYPLLIEPHLRLSQQSRWWTAGYIAVAALTSICGFRVWRSTRHRAPSEITLAGTMSNDPLERLAPRRRWRWILLAFVPSSLMLSVTTYITSEIAPIPLLWVVPLGIYLLTFILVFARRRLLPHRWMARAMPFAVLLLVLLLVPSFTARSFLRLDLPITLHLAGLFVIAMVCHGELANDRPTPSRLTEFYLWVSVGGVLGGMFNALLAPIVFPTVIEYPLTLLVACLLAPAGRWQRPAARDLIADITFPVALGLFTVGLIRFGRESLGVEGPALTFVSYGLPGIVCLGFSRRPLRFALGALAILAAAALTVRPDLHPVRLARSFYGIHRVDLFGSRNQFHALTHGSTLHGLQRLDTAGRFTPLLYYAKTGPLGQTMAALPNELKRQVAVVGLGAGTVACYGAAGEQCTFFEIDPEVERIARDPRCFTYLQDCRAAVNVVLGDARLSLESAADGQFGIMILDAFSSDTIPLHLVTREALDLYLRKLAPTGVLAFHITNRHLDLEPVFGKLAQNAGVFALCQYDPGRPGDFERDGTMESCWVVMTRDPAQLRPLTTDRRWHPPRVENGVGLWTDDYTSLFSVFSWR